MALSPKKKAFIAEYLIDLNRAEAYRRAGAARLLADVGIQSAIQAAIDDSITTRKQGERTNHCTIFRGT